MSDTHTILVVDDHPDNRELLTRRLEREGFRVLEAESGRQALTHLEDGKVSLILLDVMMPEMSGIEVLQAVREAYSASELPVIMVTAKAQSDDVVEALGQGANDYVTKPIDFPIALARIQAQLRIRRPPADDEVTDPRDLRPGLVLDGRYRLEARVADMRALDFPLASFDVVWCEGAIYNLGFETGLREWRRLLVPGGHMAVTEVCWTTSDPPQECVEFWNQEYPSIRTVPVLLRAMDICGYDCIAQFPMPQSAWWDDYYKPLQQNVAAFRERHRHEADAQQVADSVQREIDIWRKYGEFYAYEFFVMRAR